MKKKDRDQIVQMGVSELAKKAQELRDQIAKDTLKRKTTNVKNVRSVKILKKTLAVVLSVKRIKELTKE